MSRVNAFQIVRDFELEIARYTGAPYAVAVNSCTNAIFLALEYHKQCFADDTLKLSDFYEVEDLETGAFWCEIPKRTYVSVPMQIIHAGFDVKFREENWKGAYQIKPFHVFDSARRFSGGMFRGFDAPGAGYTYVCTSFHWTKILGIQQGGAILHNCWNFDQWARRARFDGRTEGVPPINDSFINLGWHMYMSPEVAAEGLVRLMHLPANNADLPNDAYPDLSQLEIFK